MKTRSQKPEAQAAQPSNHIVSHQFPAFLDSFFMRSRTGRRSSGHSAFAHVRQYSVKFADIRPSREKIFL